MEVAVRESKKIARCAFALRGSGPDRHNSDPRLGASFIRLESLIAKMLRTARCPSAAKTSTCDFLIANPTDGPATRGKSKFAAACRRDCAKVSVFNGQEPALA